MAAPIQVLLGWVERAARAAAYVLEVRHIQDEEQAVRVVERALRAYGVTAEAAERLLSLSTADLGSAWFWVGDSLAEALARLARESPAPPSRHARHGGA